MKSYEEMLNEQIKKLEVDLGVKVDRRIARYMIDRDAAIYDKTIKSFQDLETYC